MRTMSAEQKAILNSVRRNIPTEEFTIKELASKIKKSRIGVSNAVHRLEREGLLIRAGKVQSGGRGRPAIIFKRVEG